MLDKIAVLMSVYKADSLTYLIEAVESILNQTYQKFHFFISVDGPVDNDVNAFLNKINLNTKVTVFFYNDNQGLAARLNGMLDKVNEGDFSYIARMDADDISHVERLEKQLNYIKDKSLDIVGSDLIEIDENGKYKQEKKMYSEHTEILKNIVRRCPVNHPTVFMNADIFTKDNFRYDASLLNTQDYDLWIRLLEHGYTFGNQNESLLFFRVGNDFFQRRSKKKVLNEVKLKFSAWNKLSKKLSDLVFIGLFFFMRVSPTVVKKFAYKRFR